MSQTVKLQYPVTLDGNVHDELTLRRPKVRDLMVAEKQKNDAEREMTLLSNLCEVSPELIQNLDLKDYAQLQKAYQGFLD